MTAAPPVPPVPDDPLEPVRAALLHAAREDADRLLAEARRDAAEVIARAYAQAGVLLREAHLRGKAEGVRAAAATVADARREARSDLLEAKARVCDALRRRVTEQVRQCRDEETWPAVPDRLARRVRHALGADATVGEHLHGGVVGTAPGRTLDLSLDAMAARALDHAGAEIESLWET
ncbi:hypothetical protein [Streptomyces lydicus]|uniref:hypothetical protein n=1 Tax=Streptomyces lydicus TaxID=47763 RepID=UPI0037D0A0ED